MSNLDYRPQGDARWERAALETIALAAIREQRAARRWRIFFRLVYLLIFLFVIGNLVFFSGWSETSSRHTALVKLTGEIADEKLANARDIGSALDKAFADSGSVGVVLEINSPGGSPVQSGILYKRIRDLRKQYPKKPLYVVIDDICASGGYYVAAAADRIYVDPASLIGSIGVIYNGFGFAGLMDRAGVERRVQTAGANKDFLDPFKPQSDAAKAHLQTMLDQIHAQFIAAVKAGRGARLKETPETFSGLVWTGEQGVAMGLADGYGSVESVARDVLKAKDIVEYEERGSLSERLNRRIGTTLGASLATAFADAAERLGLHGASADALR
ncbi:S49 family peptidase [Chitinasiproducens palmae]|uniref:Protease-4 n=1 Tax=Chitinasiproducens palmae TaxID=1770053 RepID=A0A1H2PUQ9_9BURK|nr:S49 family peptidase [Chitinasiproducens palmae]SDV50973.1 protease-4 [Chitinasiproducens palmae]